MVTLDEIYEAIHAALQQGEKVCVATIISASGSTPRESGAKMVIWRDGRTLGTVGGGQLEAKVMEAAQEVFHSRQPMKMKFSLRNPNEGDVGICGGDAEVFLELVASRPRLVILGGGHVGRALSHVADFVGFRVVVLDSRDLPRELFLETVEVVKRKYDDLPPEYFDEDTCVVIATPKHSADEIVLRQLVNRPLAYLGMIGSKRKVALVFQHLRDEGVGEDSLSRVHAPVGLNIGAQTPEEIAISIMAEIIQTRKAAAERPGRASCVQAANSHSQIHRGE